MIIAKVIGTAVSTLKDSRMEGAKLLVVGRADVAGNLTGDPFIAVDLIGAGQGEMVMIVCGSTARVAAGGSGWPVDAAVTGILNSISVQAEQK